MTNHSSASWLFVPGSRFERFDKAVNSGAHEVVVDLEDAVAPGDKESARADVARWLDGGATAWVRVNAAGTRWHANDLTVLAACHGLRGIMVPKAESPDALRQIGRQLPSGTGLIALVESALGIRDVTAIASCPEVSRLAFGSIDFALDIDAAETDEALLFARSAVVVASRAASLPAPIDGVTVDINDAAIVSEHAASSRRLGFGGKLCIHPTQIRPVNEAFTPKRSELDWARKVLAEAPESGDPHTDAGAFTVDGQMIDRPVMDRARRILARARP